MLLKKLSYLAKHLCLWNHEIFCNEENRLLTLNTRIAEMENKQADSMLTVEETLMLGELIRE